jgi:hypothetical protein
VHPLTPDTQPPTTTLPPCPPPCPQNIKPDLSWFEQKAVAVLLTCLHLGIKNIRLGPKLPAFLTDEALAVLVEK